MNNKNWQTAGEPPSRSLFCRIQDAFRVFARAASNILGTASVFVGAITIIAI